MAKFLKSIVLMLILCWSVCISFAADPSTADPTRQSDTSQPAASEAPSMTFAETSYSFGEIVEGDEIAHEFLVKNIGGATLEIQKVQPS
jgi:hypothetical protein